MIEKYIEKDIMRQVKVAEYLFELRKINIQEIADFLEVNRITIKRDIEKILLLEPRIELIFKTTSVIEVKFWSTATRYELVKKIYGQSIFLEICYLYLNGQSNYIEIAEREHISVAKAFYLRKQVVEFFISAGIMDNEKNFIVDEFKMRLIILTIWMRIDSFNESIDKRILYQSKTIVDKIIETFSNKLHEREKYFLILVIYLSLKRKNKGLTIIERDLKYVQKGVLYSKIKNLLSNYDFNTNELVYITLMYRLVNQNVSNYQYLVIDYEDLRKFFIDDIPAIVELLRSFEKKFKRDLLKDIMFEKPFIRYIISIFIDHQMFLVEKHYFLNKKQKKLCKEISNLMDVWIKEHNFNVQISIPATERFCLQVSELLLNDSSKKWNIFIVAEDEFSHLAYREWIQRRLNTERIIINTILYYSLKDLPVYVDTDSSIIICERILLNCSDENDLNIKLFPVSLLSITEDLHKFFDFVFN